VVDGERVRADEGDVDAEVGERAHGLLADRGLGDAADPSAQEV
jgi:hypothetical protein